MDVRLTIGEFSKMTYLSVKALRHYHEIGLLAPVEVDPATGYRRYGSDQVAAAQAIRRLRELDMPTDDVREVLRAADLDERNRVIVRHLERMREQLERTQVSVESLQALLTEDPRPRADVELRHLVPTAVVVDRRDVGFDDVGEWLERAFAGLHETARSAGLTVDGPDGALYSDEFFEVGTGEVSAFVPVLGKGRPVVELPATTVAVMTHVGPFSELDQTYAALGTVVAERGIGAAGPIREHYLTTTTGEASTEVCWPVTIGALP